MPMRHGNSLSTAEALKMGLEGIISKKADPPYLSGRNPGWIKVKSRAWREANKDRRELFERS